MGGELLVSHGNNRRLRTREGVALRHAAPCGEARATRREEAGRQPTLRQTRERLMLRDNGGTAPPRLTAF